MLCALVVSGTVRGLSVLVCQTFLSGSDVEIEARRAGANAFLSKPNDMLRISEAIARLLARKLKQNGKGKEDAQKS